MDCRTAKFRTDLTVVTQKPIAYCDAT